MSRVLAIALLFSWLPLTHADGCGTEAISKVSAALQKHQATVDKFYDAKKKGDPNCQKFAMDAENSEGEWTQAIRAALASGCDANIPALKLPRAIRGMRFKCND